MRVLIVEDETAAYENLVDILGEVSYDITTLPPSITGNPLPQRRLHVIRAITSRSLICGTTISYSTILLQKNIVWD